MAETGDIKIGVTGAAGKMGSTLIRQVCETPGFRLVAASEAAGHSALGRDAGELAGLAALDVPVDQDSDALFAVSDAVLDFTLPGATEGHSASAARHGTALIIGTTGLEAEQQSALEKAGQKAAIVQAPNMSLCVNLLMRLAEQAAALLDEDYDIEIVEMHHRHKVDAPSGTALGLGRAVAKGRGVSLDAVADRGRDGVTGARQRGAIGFAALRGGDVVGDHSVIFAADGERLELTHKSASRQTYARGALRAAAWAQGKSPGLYTMADVLEFAAPS
ncbi:MAG: 4-hydroxy-tetrahydrodipicolinate reductase [Alphaproteobacteria bacterium MarineAlpha10_Bin2]|nr:MAG: 4-hydroxy-tetrahydrodipicolinate reductase [Alphaproteobacteria bacterium MarineAlpha10_Bin2]